MVLIECWPRAHGWIVPMPLLCWGLFFKDTLYRSPVLGNKTLAMYGRSRFWWSAWGHIDFQEHTWLTEGFEPAAPDLRVWVSYVTCGWNARLFAALVADVKLLLLLCPGIGITYTSHQKWSGWKTNRSAVIAR